MRGCFEFVTELALDNPPKPFNSCPKSIIELFPSSKQVSVSSVLLGLEPWGERGCFFWRVLFLLVGELVKGGGSLKNKHITAQSSILALGYLYLHVATACLTTIFAAFDLLGAEATMFITSLFVSTSQIWKRKGSKKCYFL